MKVLMISKDARIAEEGTPVRLRMAEYGQLAEELHIVVVARNVSDTNLRIANNVFVYLVGFRGLWSYLQNGVAAARRVAVERGFGPGDVVTCQDPFESGLVGWCVARRCGAALELQIHTDFLSPFFRKESLRNRVRVGMAGWLLPCADCVRTVSLRIKKSLAARSYRLHTEPRVMPIFVDVKKIENAQVPVDLHQKYPQFDFLILMASRLTREKNIGMALSAMPEIIKRHPGAGLIIVGDGPEKERLQAQIARLKMEQHIIMENWNDDLSSYYKTADLFLLTSDYEGYGMSVVEAMAAGCPVMMTDVGLAGEILLDGVNGLVVPVGGSAILAEKISEIAGNDYLAKSFAQKGRETVFRLPDKVAYLENYGRQWRACAAGCGTDGLSAQKRP